MDQPGRVPRRWPRSRRGASPDAGRAGRSSATQRPGALLPRVDDRRAVKPGMQF